MMMAISQRRVTAAAETIIASAQSGTEEVDAKGRGNTLLDTLFPTNSMKLTIKDSITLIA